MDPLVLIYCINCCYVPSALVYLGIFSFTMFDYYHDRIIHNNTSWLW